MGLEHVWPLVGAVGLAAVALLLKRLDSAPITMPMICLALGACIGVWGEVPFNVMNEELEVFAEITLAVVLFTDASRLKIRQLKHQAGWALRMLFVGGSLSIVLGTVVFWGIFPGLPIWQVALLAALLTPTDAALGESVIHNSDVPENLRETVAAESGLNDGLALPAILFLACAAVGFDHELQQDHWLIYAAQQIGFGLLLGLFVGAMGGWASHEAISRGWSSPEHGALFALLLIAVIYFLAEIAGGNSFLAVFCGGLTFGAIAKECADRAREFLTQEGQLLLMMAFFTVGGVMVPTGLSALNWQIVLAVLAALIIVRPASIYLSLLGSGATTREKLFLGWFGPRGLATALFTLLILSEFRDRLESDVLLSVAALAVLSSAILHGVTAYYATRIFKLKNDAG